MWLLAMFDLPTRTGRERGMYIRFRKMLLTMGFASLQKSVYLMWLDSGEAADARRREILANAPAAGAVTVLPLTQRALSLASTLVDGTIQPPLAIPDDFVAV